MTEPKRNSWQRMRRKVYYVDVELMKRVVYSMTVAVEADDGVSEAEMKLAAETIMARAMHDRHGMEKDRFGEYGMEIDVDTMLPAPELTYETSIRKAPVKAVHVDEAEDEEWTYRHVHVWLTDKLNIEIIGEEES